MASTSYPQLAARDEEWVPFSSMSYADVARDEEWVPFSSMSYADVAALQAEELPTLPTPTLVTYNYLLGMDEVVDEPTCPPCPPTGDVGPTVVPRYNKKFKCEHEGCTMGPYSHKSTLTKHILKKHAADDVSAAAASAEVDEADALQAEADALQAEAAEADAPQAEADVDDDLAALQAEDEADSDSDSDWFDEVPLAELPSVIQARADALQAAAAAALQAEADALQAEAAEADVLQAEADVLQAEADVLQAEADGGGNGGTSLHDRIQEEGECAFQIACDFERLEKAVEVMIFYRKKYGNDTFRKHMTTIQNL